MSRFEALVWLSTLVDFSVAATLLFVTLRRPDMSAGGRRLGLGRAFLAGAATFAVALVKLWYIAGLGLHGFVGFGIVHLLYLDLVVVLPALGLAVILAGRRWRGREPWRRPTRSVFALGLAALALAPVGAYASFVEPYNLQLERAQVPLPPERTGVQTGTRPVRIGVLADIQTAHVDGYERRVVERMMALRPDIILLPGDLYQSYTANPRRDAAELAALRRLLARLSAPGGVFFVPGDSETPAKIRGALSGTRVQVLRNELARTQVRGRRVTIGGVELAYRSPAARATVRRLGRAPGDADVRILLAHRPDVALLPATSSRIDLTVAGHTHGGQLNLPFLGPPVTASGVPTAVAAGGLHRLRSGNRIYVSRGIGVERGRAPHFRFLAPPEISLLEL